MESEIPKVYSPEEIEPRWAREWVERKLYTPDGCSDNRFSLVIPPPNITGSLHMGHMLEHTEIDILMRWRRMRGATVLWLPGTDHASIATQMIVEREIGREALPALKPGPEANRAWQREGQRLRLEMGPKRFLERCWEWKAQNGGTIRRQMERLGASCDWTRERFTMDEAYSRSVVEAFIRLYEQGLIYRDFYIVSWCPRCRTALSDLEVAHEEKPGKLWFIRYPLQDGSGFVTVATTRPETMLGDAAVAVNPGDPRFANLTGRHLRLPLTDRIIPIIADDFVDPSFGAGAVKITPAHDFNDFAAGLRHGLPRFSVIDEGGRMTAAAGAYQGQDRYEARKNVLRDLESQGFIEKIEDYNVNAGVCQRCKTIVEPLISKQWFMKMQPLAEPALAAVQQEDVRILPESGKKKYLNWMTNIHDWCISRQLWWGHRIPAWFCDPCQRVIVAREQPQSCPGCGAASLRAETDVLDTWFSSALWPFATLGWPDATADLKCFYPNNLMIMGEDILFFWGARMIMMGLRLTSEAPFQTLYIHALVRDAERQKMSKTKGNVLDPLEVTEQFGTDAVRFALAISAAPGTDITFSKEKIESYRAFANKIWNAARFVLMNLGKLPEGVREQLGQALIPSREPGLRPAAGPGGEIALIDRWIYSRISSVNAEINHALEEFRFHEAAYAIYHFFWHELCDWYLEWVKPEITKPQTKLSAAWINLLRIFEAALRLLHPFMPFITEELWHQLPRPSGAVSISLTGFDLIADDVSDPVAEREFDWITEMVVAIRKTKAEQALQRERPSAQIAAKEARVLDLFRTYQDAVLRLAGLNALNFTSRPAADSIPVGGNLFFRLLLESQPDGAAERRRLEREKSKIEQSLAQARQQLENQEFIRRAPPEVIRGVEQRRRDLSAQFEKILESLSRLGA